MMKSQCVFVVVAVLVAVTLGADPVCTKKSLCSCETDKGMIDLTPLSSEVIRTNDARGKYNFEYSPCSENITSPCMDAMICRSALMGGHKTLGKSAGESFISKNGDVAIEYPGDDNKTSIVILKCSQTTESSLTLVYDSNDEYVFELASPYACVGGPAAVTTKSTPKASKTTPKATKTTPKASKTTPKATKTTPKASKTTPKATKTTPKASKTTPKATKTTPKASKTTPKATKTTPKASKTTPKATKTTPKASKSTPKASKSTPKPTKSTPKTPKSTPKSTKTTPKVSSTTHGGAVSHSSISLAALSIFALMCRQLF